MALAESPSLRRAYALSLERCWRLFGWYLIEVSAMKSHDNQRHSEPHQHECGDQLGSRRQAPTGRHVVKERKGSRDRQDDAQTKYASSFLVDGGGEMHRGCVHAPSCGAIRCSDVLSLTVSAATRRTTCSGSTR